MPFWGSLAPLVSLSSRYSSRCATVIPTVFASASAVCAASPISITLNATTQASRAQTSFRPVTYTITSSVPFKVKRQSDSDDLNDDDGGLSTPVSGSVITWSLLEGMEATATAFAAAATSGTAATSSSFATGHAGSLFMSDSWLGSWGGIMLYAIFGLGTGVLAVVL